jgi:Zn-dependent peptidase ImmA (M78 family)
MNITLQPRVLRWARERAGLDESALAKKLGIDAERLTEWETSGELPFRKAELLAQKTHTPFGHLFLREPPEDSLPIPDFRTVGDAPVLRPSPDLLDTVFLMQRRQDWLREFLIEEGEPPIDWVGSVFLQSNTVTVAQGMRQTLGRTEGWAAEVRTWAEALIRLREKIEGIGVSIVINGIVGNNTRRKLEPDEFRGFAISDRYAPLIFVNGSDFKAAQMFTLVHELAHLWLGEGGVSNFDEALQPVASDVERWCNAVAAEFLVPAHELRAVWHRAQNDEEPYQFLARRFKVSSVVAARSAMDTGLVSRESFLDFYREYKEDQSQQRGRRGGGGDFWALQNLRVGQRFGSAVIQATREGRLPYREAYNLTGLSGVTFERFAEKLGFQPR